MPQLKGVIKTPTGEPLGGATITLTSLHNRAGILKGVFSHVTTQNGEYNFPVLPGVYSVRLTQSVQRLSEIGVIRVYEDSADGSLNDFLGATDIDLRPESLKKYEELAQQAQQSAEAAAESEQQAGQHADAAAREKEEVKNLAKGVQQNADAVAEGKQQAENLVSQVENAAEEVKKDAEAAKQAASDAEHVREDIDTALSATLKTANRLSELADEGEEAQQESRDNLGLKSAATMTPQSDIRDRTEGRLATPGAFGFGHRFIPGEAVRFKSEADFLAWARYVEPGEYYVDGANGVLPGIVFQGVISIRWLEANQNPPLPSHTAKAIIFYGINGNIYYNRYWSTGNGWLTGWENLKVNEVALRELIETRAPLESPEFTGKPTTPTPPDDAAGNETANAEFVRKLLKNTEGSSSGTPRISEDAKNLLKTQSDALFVDGTHPVIPKVTGCTLNTGLGPSYGAANILPGGSRVYTREVDMPNPIGMTSVGYIGIFVTAQVTPGYLYLNNDRKYIPVQYFVTSVSSTASGITVKIQIVMTDTPCYALDISTLQEEPGDNEGNLPCILRVHAITGVTLRQLGWG